VHKRHPPQLTSEPMIVSVSPVPVLIYNLVRLLLFLLSIFFFMIFILINLLPFEKVKGIVLAHPLYNLSYANLSSPFHSVVSS